MSLNKQKLWSIAKGGLIAGSAAGLTYTMEHLTELNLGSNTALVAMVFSIVIQTLRKLLEGDE